MIILAVLSLIAALYFLYMAIIIFNMSDNHWNSYRKFKGSGNGMKIDSNNNIVFFKYKTSEDCKRFLHGIRNI